MDVSALRAMSGGSVAPTAVPRLAKLYAKDEDTDRFILVLEGRVHVTIGQGSMTFEAGPWHRFGSEILKKLEENAHNLTRSSSIVGQLSVAEFLKSQTRATSRLVARISCSSPTSRPSSSRTALTWK